jgi:broad specificity phosphatase PhoE
VRLLLLIRHGESEGNAAQRLQGQGEYPLSELGREQARRLADRLSKVYDDIAVIYTSSLSRAVETAQILAEAVGAPVVPDDRLQEYDVGQLTGLTMEDIRERFPQIYAAWMEDVEEWISMPGGERNESFRQRVREVFAEIAARHDGDEDVVVVSHGGTLGAYLAQIMGLSPERRSPFSFSNASLTVVDLSRRRSRLIQHNDTCHLAGLEGGG